MNKEELKEMVVELSDYCNEQTCSQCMFNIKLKHEIGACILNQMPYNWKELVNE